MSLKNQTSVLVTANELLALVYEMKHLG